MVSAVNAGKRRKRTHEKQEGEKHIQDRGLHPADNIYPYDAAEVISTAKE